MLVVSLAVTDLMVGMILFIGAWNWIPSINALISTSGAFCVARLCWYFGCCAVSMLNLSAIACERYLYIVHPYWHQDFVNAKVVGGCICAVWTAGIAYGISPLFIYKYTLEHKCDIYYVLGPAYAIYSAIGVFVFTSILTLVFYSLIARLVWQKRHGTCPSDLARANAGRTRSGVRVESLRKKLRALKAPIVVYGVFFLSWSPYIITYLLHDLGAGAASHHQVDRHQHRFLNSAMNFFVYLSLNGQFRRAVLFELGGCRKGGTEIATVSGQEGSSTQTTGNNTTVPGYVKGVWRTNLPIPRAENMWQPILREIKKLTEDHNILNNGKKTEYRLVKSSLHEDSSFTDLR
nr:hypothetical protein BaRGS_015508 [Batillaria attramentaria]